MYKRILLGMVAFAIMTVLLAACTIRDAASIPSGPSVHMGNAAFLQTSITIKKGDKIHLVDDVAVTHIITNGTWQGSTQKPGKESGAPDVKLNFTGSDSQSTPSFNTAGTFKLYCTIHGGMNLDVKVQ